MRAFVLGATGMLGHDLVDAVPDGITFGAARDARVDITQPDAVERALDDARPDWVVNAAGYTAVDRAEDEPDRANAVNGTAVGALAGACLARGIRLVHFSTDYVFSGRASKPYHETDACEPIGAYARSKRLGEELFAASGVHGLLIRTQWLFGAHGKSFPRTMLERARARAPTRVVDDQLGRPTYTRDLARWTWALVARGAEGTIHAANDGTATWFDVARVVFGRVGAGELLEPCSTADYPTKAVRPAFSVLDTTRLTGLLGEVPSWADALDRFLTSLES